MSTSPSHDEIRDQGERICASAALEGTLMAGLLRYLLKLDRDGGFAVKRPKLTGRSVVLGFYRDSDVQINNEESTYKSGRTLVGELRTALVKYYGVTANDEEDRILIDISRGKGPAYRPICSYRHLSSLRNSEFRYLGDNEDGMRELLNMIGEATVIEDTAVRWHSEDKPSLYSEELMGRFAEALLTNVSLEFRSITGPIVDAEYAKTLRTAYGERPGKLKSRKLHHTAPLMNFLILYGKKRPDRSQRQVVFFGYGRQTGEDVLDDTAVFFSEHPQLVKEYKRLFKVLQGADYSRSIGMDESDFWISHEHKTDIIASFPEWPTEIGRRIAESNKQIVICIAGWPGMGNYLPDLGKALSRNVPVTVALWNPESELVALRTLEVGEHLVAKRRKDIHFVSDTIHQNLSSLENLREVHGKLKILQCNGWGGVTLFWIDERIYFGFYWAELDSLRGPHFLVRSDTKLGLHLQKQFEAMTRA